MKPSIATRTRAQFEQAHFAPQVEKLVASELVSQDTIDALNEGAKMMRDVSVQAREEGTRLALMAIAVALMESMLDPESLTAIKGVGDATVAEIKAANRKRGVSSD